MRFRDLSINLKISIPIVLLGLISIGGALFAGAQSREAQSQMQYIINGPQAASLKLARAFRYSLRATMAIYENIVATDMKVSRAAQDLMKQQIALANEALQEAAAITPTFAAELDKVRNTLNTVLTVNCAETIALADGAESMEQTAAAAASMGKGCAQLLDKVTNEAADLNGRMMAYTDKLQAETAAHGQLMNIIGIATISGATLPCCFWRC